MKLSSLALPLAFALALAAAGGPAQGQGGENPLVSSTRYQHDQVKDYLLKTAGQLAEGLYTYRPTPEVRSVAQLLGHVADTNFAICAAALGEKPPRQDVEKSATGKAELGKALAASFAFCDKAFAATTDANAAKMVDFFGTPMARLATLSYNAGHNYEHYGNLVTYMRLNKIVPPSSQPMKQ